MFYNSSEFKLVDKKWCLDSGTKSLYTPSKYTDKKAVKVWTKQQGLDSLSIKPSEWKKVALISLSNDECLIKIYPKRNKDGARASGIVLAALIDFYGIRNVPTNVYVWSERGFQLRAYLVFNCFASNTKRHTFLKSFKDDFVCPVDNGDNAKSYEKKAVELYKTQKGELSKLKLEENKIKTGNIRKIEFDGFLCNDKKAVIIEVKKLKQKDFSEGVAQLIQNYCLVANNTAFSHLKSINTELITPTSSFTKFYSKALSFLKSKNEINFFIWN